VADDLRFFEKHRLQVTIKEEELNLENIRASINHCYNHLQVRHLNCPRPNFTAVQLRKTFGKKKPPAGGIGRFHIPISI
jgi:hypothetical protein